MAMIFKDIPLELKNEYPFSSHYFSPFFSLGKEKMHYEMHYIDEGEGDPIVMVHGNPTWSFFYRNLAKALQKNYRVIVPDHIGCGLSSKPQDYNYTLKNHIDNLSELINNLQLKNITLIVHDWGGAIGMGFATAHPHLIKKIVVMNTAAFLSPLIPWQINLLKNPIGFFAIRAFNLFAYPATFMSTTKPLDPLIKKGFLLPYFDFKSRIATAKFVEDIPLNKNHQSYQTLKEIENNLKNIKVPLLILWGEKDFCFTMDFFKRWKEYFPKAKAISFKNAGHYLLEDEKDKVINEIEIFLKD